VIIEKTMKEIGAYKMPLIGFVISLLVVFGCMNIWTLTILSPIFVFIVLKFLKIWKSKERLLIGIPAIFVGIILFFAVFSYEISDVPIQNFESSSHSIKATVIPYSSQNTFQKTYINVTYNGITNSTLKYRVEEAKKKIVVVSGEVKGNISGNVTEYTVALNLKKGVYAVNLTVGNDTLIVSALRLNTWDIFILYLYFPGMYLMFLLSSLYALFIFGVHIIRRGQKKVSKNEKKA